MVESIFVPFPRRMMSSARAPSVMSTTYARDTLNLYTTADGAGTKRNGFTATGTDLGKDIQALTSYITSNGEQQILALSTTGAMHLQTAGGWQQVYTGLSTQGTLRSTYFAGLLIIVNGIDDVLVWDGSTMQPLVQHWPEIGINLTYISSTQFSIESDISFYNSGSTLTAGFADGTSATGTISSVTEANGVLTVTLTSGVLQSDLADMTLHFKPPPFASVYAAHDRLWGFGRGPLEPTDFNADVDRTRVFYTHGVNDAYAWYSPTGVLPNINLADKMGTADELLAMAEKDGLTVFFGRNATQIWAGTDPTATGDFTWTRTLPVGVLHGDLVVQLPNDIGFFTATGARTLSRTLATAQLDVGDFGAEITPTIREAVGALRAQPAAYRQAQSMQYARQGWFGFKVGPETLIFQINQDGLAWSRFDGFFQAGTAFLNTSDGALYTAIGGQLYQYDAAVWSDAGQSILTRWWLPWLNVGDKFKRWANKAYTCITDQGALIDLTVQRYVNYDSASPVPTLTQSTKTPDYWDISAWDEALWDNNNPKAPIQQDKFVADVFAFAIESNTTTGPLTHFGMKIEGVRER